ncbi:MAG: UDP-N-acetylmuramoyl-L-alanine--D-glutamate ligase [Opitutales bacterium]|jgi:UDP-N-acetylmuramoylalanine--D-glutamate ligase
MSNHSNIPSDIEPLLARPVAVLGYGVSGQALGGLLARIGADFVFYDTKGRNAVHLFDAAAAAGHSLVLYSPGFAQGHPWLEAARVAGCALMGELEFASRFWRGRLICITGTNGKTTMTELVAAVLNLSGQKALCVGNIGRPLSDIALRPECEGWTAVCETSSFQAESLDKFRADSLIWVNFFNNHLDRHGDAKGYFAVKWKLVERLRGTELVLGESVAAAAERFGYELPDFAQVVGPGDYVPWTMPPDSAFGTRRQAENLLLVRRWWATSGLDTELVRRAAISLTPLPHRLNRIPAPGGVTFWNDSKATNYEACIGALENFDSKVIWIGGGMDRGETPEDLASAVAPRVRLAVLTGQCAPELARCLDLRGVPSICADSLKDAVLAAWQNAQKGENILFSPGHSSHDSFRDYTERGRFFESVVAGLGDPNDHLPKSDEQLSNPQTQS